MNMTKHVPNILRGILASAVLSCMASLASHHKRSWTLVHSSYDGAHTSDLVAEKQIVKEGAMLYSPHRLIACPLLFEFVLLIALDWGRVLILTVIIICSQFIMCMVFSLHSCVYQCLSEPWYLLSTQYLFLYLRVDWVYLYNT